MFTFFFFFLSISGNDDSDINDESNDDPRRTSLGDSMGNLTRLVVDMSRQTVLVAASTLLLMTATYFAGKWIGSSVSQDQHRT